MIPEFVYAHKHYTTYKTAVPMPLFRKSFSLSEVKDGSFLKIAALGFYRAFVNGNEITKGLLAPYISNPYHLNYYDKYCVDSQLRIGENVISVFLANGFRNDEGGQIWDFDKAPFRGAPALCLEFVSGETSFTARDMLWKDSAFLYDDYRCGIVYDARLRRDGDILPGGEICEEEWSFPSLLKDEVLGELRECLAEPIRIYKERSAISVTPDSKIIYKPRSDVPTGEMYLSGDDFDSGYLYDFGYNTAGTARIKIRGRRGQRISLRFGELRNGNDLDLRNINFQPDGFVQRCIYILSGDGEETFEIPFTYYGYRYCHVHGIDEEQAELSLVTMLQAASDIERRTEFFSSSSTVNKIFEIASNSDISNFYYFPNDCPQREKNGWTGDASESSERMLLLYGAEKSFDQWYDSIILAQDERGAFPGIVPTGGWGFAWGNGPAWDRVIVNLPYYVYKYTGDTDMIQRGSEAIMRYLRYIAARRSPDGTIEIGLGDYCQCGRPADQPTTPIRFTDTVVSKDIADKAAYLLSLIHYDWDEIKYARALAASLKTAARCTFLNTSDMSLAGGTQTAQAFGLEYGIFEPEEEKLAVERLVKEIQNDGGLMNFGFLGSRVVFHALSRFGYSPLAYSMITRKDMPSYGHIVSKGHTSMPERFSTKKQKVTHCSFNHHFHCDVSHWFIRNILGLNVNPGLKNPNSITVSPCRIREIEHAEGKRRMPGGEVSVYWIREKGCIDVTVSVTGNVSMSIDKGEYELDMIDSRDGLTTFKFIYAKQNESENQA